MTGQRRDLSVCSGTVNWFLCGYCRYVFSFGVGYQQTGADKQAVGEEYGSLRSSRTSFGERELSTGCDLHVTVRILFRFCRWISTLRSFQDPITGTYR